MTTKEQYSLGNSADEWVDIPLKTFKEMLEAGYEVEYCSSGEDSGPIWVRATCSSVPYNDSFSPFRTTRSEYMRFLNRVLSEQNDAFVDSMRKAARMDYDAVQQSDPKSRPDLLPSKAVLAAGRVLAFGLSKHPDEKWKTLSVEDHVAAALRHIYQHQDGPDEETGESHLAHALCRIAFAIARSQGD